MDYNYEHFDEYIATGADEVDFGEFKNMLHAGEPAPDGTLQVLDGGTVRLSELWAERTVLLEFGSFT